MEKCVKRLRRGKATGVDGMVNEVLKYGGEGVVGVIWELCVKCFEVERVPDQWLKSVIFPLYKGGDRGSVES